MDGAKEFEANFALNRAAGNVWLAVNDLWVDLMNTYQDFPLLDCAESSIRQARDTLDRILERNEVIKK